jgi:hypothetical protein
MPTTRSTVTSLGNEFSAAVGCCGCPSRIGGPEEGALPCVTPEAAPWRSRPPGVRKRPLQTADRHVPSASGNGRELELRRVGRPHGPDIGEHPRPGASGLRPAPGRALTRPVPCDANETRRQLEWDPESRENGMKSVGLARANLCPAFTPQRVRRRQSVSKSPPLRCHSRIQRSGR